MIGQALKSIRGIYGYKAKDVAEQLGISAGYLSDIEAEKKAPSLDMLKNFSELYGIRMSSIIYLAEEIPEGTLSVELRRKIHDRVLKTIHVLGSDTNLNNNEE